MSLEIIHGDCVDICRGIASNTIQLVVTSPPYDQMRTGYPTGFRFEALAMELSRILKPGGAICWNINDSTVGGSETLTSCKQKIFFHEQCGLNIHDTMIWKKPNFSNPSQTRYHQVFEYVFVFSKGKPVFNPIKDKPNKYPNGPWGKNTFRKANGDMAVRRINPATPFGMRGNVWSGNTVGQEMAGRNPLHSAKMPDWLARDLIISWSNPTDTVLDPMAGSGTTLWQAIKLNRNTIGIDSDKASIDLMVRTSTARAT